MTSLTQPNRLRTRRDYVRSDSLATWIHSNRYVPKPILEVGEYYELLTAQLESAYGRRHPRWVRGEVAKVYEKTISTWTSWTPDRRPRTQSDRCSTRTAGPRSGIP
jgi:hypothetical protein